MASIAGQQSATTQKDKFTPASKFIELVQYDPTTNSMDVTFKSGSVHRYLSITPTAYATFKQSPTHDSFYSRMIKGRDSSVPIRLHNIGTNKSKPLDKKSQRRILNNGIRDPNAKPRTAGTVARAFVG